MKHYVKVENDVVVNRTVFENTIPEEWGDGTWIADEVAQIGWTLVDGVFTPPPKVVVKIPTTVEMIKAEAQRRIFEFFPAWKQSNMIARGVELQDAWRVAGAWTAQEQAEADKLKQVWAWIKAIRARSDFLETTLPDDYTSDVHWS